MINLARPYLAIFDYWLSRPLGSLLTLAIAVLISTACQTASGPSPDTAQPYILGVALPFTGPIGSYGVDLLRGIELAVEEMNLELQQAGSPIQFRIASVDTESKPDRTTKAVQSVVQTSGAEVIVGPLMTSGILAAKQYVDDNQVVLISPASSGQAAAIADDYIYRVMYPPDAFASQAFVQIARERTYEHVAVLQIDDPYGNSMTELFEDGFQNRGGSEVVVIKYTQSPTDVSGEVTKVVDEIGRLAGTGKTAFFCICSLGVAQMVLQQVVVDPVMASVDWLGVENLVHPEILSDPSHAQFLGNVTFTSVSVSDHRNPNTQPFVDAFVDKFGSEPGPFTNYAYDAANIAMLSILAAGNDGARVQSILPYIANHYIGTSVQTFLDENGDQAIAHYGIYQVEPDGSRFAQIGTYDGALGEVAFSVQQLDDLTVEQAADSQP